jgi:hypothetical protein
MSTNIIIFRRLLVLHKFEKMRQIAGLYSDFANESWPLNETYTSSYAFCFINSCAIGIPPNLIVVYLSFFCRHVEGEFKYFLGNLAVIDLLYCCSNLCAWLIQTEFISHNWLSNVIWCTIQVEPQFTFAIASAMALPLISVNRYFVIIRESTWFTVKRIALLCLYPYSILIWWILNVAYAPFVTVFARCGYTLYTPYVPEVFVFPITIGYFTLIFCNWKIYRRISEHISTTTALMIRSGNNFTGEKAILKAIVIQAMIPLVCVAPAGIYFVYFSIYNRAAANLVPFSIGKFRPTIEDYAYGTFSISPSCNAFVTLIIITPYRQAEGAFVSKMKNWLCLKWGIAEWLERRNAVNGWSFDRVRK